MSCSTRAVCPEGGQDLNPPRSVGSGQPMLGARRQYVPGLRTGTLLRARPRLGGGAAIVLDAGAPRGVAAPGGAPAPMRWERLASAVVPVVRTAAIAPTCHRSRAGRRHE